VGEQGRVSNSKGITSEPAIMPEGGRRAITDVNGCNGAISRQLVTNNLPQIGRGRSWIISKHRVIEEEPFFPWSLSASEELINKFKQQTSILGL
jgi:hypothetical protein